MDHPHSASNPACLVPGRAEGPLLHSDVGLSFWGGVDPETGIVIDRSHPLAGQSLAGRIVALPSGRGSCTGSSVMLQLILNGCAPAGMVFAEREDILTLGSIVAEELFGPSVPMIHVGPDAFAGLAGRDHLAFSDGLMLDGAAGRPATPLPIRRQRASFSRNATGGSWPAKRGGRPRPPCGSSCGWRAYWGPNG